MGIKTLILLAKNYYTHPRYVLRQLISSPKSSIKVLRAGLRFQNFIQNLTNMDSAEVRKYIDEITSNQEFREHLVTNLSYSGDETFVSGGVGTTVGTILYVLCRNLRPDIAVETGVSSGVSSAYILHALEENKRGNLYSIDLPYEEGKVYSEGYFGPCGATGLIPRGQQSGWLIPDYLRHRWELTVGRTSDKLKPLLGKLGTIDIFLHDSEHSYQNMLWEYKTAWFYLRKGGILISHNVDANDAFNDFCKGVGVKGFLFANTGAAKK